MTRDEYIAKYERCDEDEHHCGCWPDGKCCWCGDFGWSEDTNAPRTAEEAWPFARDRLEE